MTDIGDAFDDILVPPAESGPPPIKDSFDYNVAFNFGFIGVGQCGGRIATTFGKLGYSRVCAVNTTIQDLAELKIPDTNKLDVGDARGAGKDPAAAAAVFADKDEDIFDLLQRSWGDSVDYGFVCLAAAGGTGAGGFTKTAEVVRRYLQHCKRPVRVGAIVALPRDDEGQRFAQNALHTMRQLASQSLSPIILIDNQKIRELYPTVAAGVIHSTENQATATLLHVFNRLAGSDSDHTTFDRADFAKLLDSGLITFAADNISQWATASDITGPIRDRLRRNILATVEFNKSTVAGLLYVLNPMAYDNVPSAFLDSGTAMFTRMLAENSTVFPGVYRGGQSPVGIRVLAMIGKLPLPRQRILDLAARAGVAGDDVSRILGV